jgi:hypothetical protein
MKPISLLRATAALIMGATPAFAANWVYVVTQDNSARYYDAETIQRSGNLVTVWEKWGRSADVCCTLVQRVRFNCAIRTSTLLAAKVYYFDGSIAADPEYSSPYTTSVIFPDSPEEKMLKAVCRRS